MANDFSVIGDDCILGLAVQGRLSSSTSAQIESPYMYFLLVINRDLRVVFILRRF